MILTCTSILYFNKDFYGHPKAAAAAGLLSSSEGSQISYNIGDYLPLLKSGKFPAITQNDLRLVLDRFLLTKVVRRDSRENFEYVNLLYLFCYYRARFRIVMKDWRKIFLQEITRYEILIPYAISSNVNINSYC